MENVLAPPLEVKTKYVAHERDTGLYHAVRAPRDEDCGGWWNPHAETVCGRRSIYPAVRWTIEATWWTKQAVTCPACFEVSSQLGFGW